MRAHANFHNNSHAHATHCALLCPATATAATLIPPTRHPHQAVYRTRRTTSHDATVVSALYNRGFNQVRVWWCVVVGGGVGNVRCGAVRCSALGVLDSLGVTLARAAGRRRTH